MQATLSCSHLKRGAHLIDQGHTQFCLWAPEALEVSVVLNNDQIYPMQRSEEFPAFYCAVVACGVGTRYQYRVINKEHVSLTVPDPASRAQADSVHGASLVVDANAYAWRVEPWSGRPWHETVLYELHVGIFGGFNGVKNRLSALAAMGFTAVSLMPVASFPGSRNWGYDGVLLYAPHFSYGTPEDLKSLVDEAHALNMSIFLDVVYNHFGPEGNYLHHYAPQFFDAQQQTPWGNAIHFQHPEVRSFYTENVMYWLEVFHFDGLRFDACHAIHDKSWLFEVAARVHSRLGSYRHVHLVAENDDNAVPLLQNGFSAQWNDDAHHAMHVLLTGEQEGYYAEYAKTPAEYLARALSNGFIFEGKSELYPSSEPLDESTVLSPTAFVFYLQNHDQIGNRPFGERLTTLVPDRTLRVANALVLLCPHIPMLFMGEEFAATQPFLYFTSHEDEALIGAVREGRRKEFSAFSKFADSTFALKIPDPNHADTFEASIPRPTSVAGLATSSALDWHQWVSSLLGIRHRYIIPKLPNAKALFAKAIGPSAVLAAWCMGDGSTLVIALNLGNERLVLSQQEVCDGEVQILFDYGQVWEALARQVFPGNAFLALIQGPL